MGNKIEVGEYVKTKEGRIAQIKSIDYEAGIYRFDRIIYINDFRMKEDVLYNNEMFKKVIVNHSKQLIDLIEVGDIVEIRTGLHSSFKYFVENEDNLLLLEEKVKQFWNIKTILTKEQFEANCYKAGGEDE
jgi:hypothetical protein|nr:MAG TPA: hypothetical protein [Caudoviricetes sp.]